MPILCTPPLRPANKNKRTLVTGSTIFSFRVSVAVSIISVVCALVYASVSLEAPPGLTVSFISKIKSLAPSMNLESTSGCTVFAGTMALEAMLTLGLFRAVYKYVAASVALACLHAPHTPRSRPHRCSA